CVRERITSAPDLLSPHGLGISQAAPALLSILFFLSALSDRPDSPASHIITCPVFMDARPGHGFPPRFLTPILYSQPDAPACHVQKTCRTTRGRYTPPRSYGCHPSSHWY